MIIHNDHRTARLVTCKVHEPKEDQRRDAKPIIIIYKAEAAHVPLPSFILVNLRFCQALCQITLLFCHHIPDTFVSCSMFYLCQNLLRARTPPVSGSREDVLRIKQTDDRRRVRQLHTLITKGFQTMKCTDTRQFQGLTFQHTCLECAFEQHRAHDAQGSQD